MPDHPPANAIAIFERAIQLPGEERLRYLEETCGGDALLRSLVEKLLAADEQGMGDFLEPDTVDLADVPASEVTPPPDRVGRYRIIRKLGQGGMGMVFEAEQDQPHRKVALKMIRGGKLVSQSDVNLFHREAEALARLQHPGIATILESGSTDDGQNFFAMELVPGTTLGAWRAARTESPSHSRVELELRLRILQDVCSGVNFAHQRGVIHRDLKPANVMVLPEEVPGEGLPTGTRIKILDFGVAKIVDTEGTQPTRTQAGILRGTLQYMSPEQAGGSASAIDVRSDVYALGVMLYELVLDCVPYDLPTGDVLGALRVICESPPHPAVRVWKGTHRLDRDLETILQKALAKEPSERYQSALALSEDIDRYLKRLPILAHPPSTAYHVRKFVARHQAETVSVAALLLLLIGFAITVSVQNTRIAQEAERALKEATNARVITTFLESVFGFADPLSASGEEETRLDSMTARDILESARKSLVTQDLASIEQGPELYATLGSIHRSAGAPQEALELLTTAAAMGRERGLPRSDQWQIELDRASALMAVGEPQAADSIIGAALAAAAAGDELEASVVGFAHHLRSAMQMRAGHPDSAAVGYRQAIALYESSSETRGFHRAMVLQDLGVALTRMRGQAEAAMETLQVAIATMEKEVGRFHIERARALHNLGVLYLNTGRFEEAEGPLEESVEIYRSVIGADGRTARVLSNLAGCYYEQGKTVEARQAYEEGGAILRELGLRDGKAYGKYLVNTADLMSDDGNHADAIERYGEAIRVLEESCGRMHPETGAAILNRSTAYERMGDLRAALADQEEALRIDAEVSPRDFVEEDLARCISLSTALGDTLRASGFQARLEALRQ